MQEEARQEIERIEERLAEAKRIHQQVLPWYSGRVRVPVLTHLNTKEIETVGHGDGTWGPF